MLEKKRNIILIFVLLAGIVFIGNNAISLWDQDEAAYAGFGKQMIETGDYVIPQYTWSAVHRKTPLHFWLIAVAFKIFGINEFAVRFFSSTAIFLIYVLIFVYGKKFLDKKEALLASLVLGTSIFMPALAKIAVTDGVLLFFETLAAFALIEVLRTKSFVQVLIFWFAISMGMLVKGPPILIFAGFMIILLFAFHPKRLNLIRLHPWIFGFVSLLPLYFWGRAAWAKDNGEFVKWLIDWYILTRVDKAVFSQTGPPGYFVVSFMLFFIAYLTFLPTALVNAFKSIKYKEKNTFLLFVWLVSGWLFYELVKSKLPTYAVAAYPAIAMLISTEIIKFQTDKKSLKLVKIGSILQITFAVLLFAVAIWAIIFFSHELNIMKKIMVVFVPFLFLAGSGIATTLLYNKKTKKFTATIIINAFVFTLLIFTLLIPMLDGLRNSTKRTAEYVATNPNIEKIVIANGYAKPPSLPFYLELNNPNAEIEIDYDLNSLLQKYQSDTAYAFILKEEQIAKIKELDPRADVRQISSLTTAKDGKNNYFITFNKCINCE